jgi:hypothetical protein
MPPPPLRRQITLDRGYGCEEPCGFHEGLQEEQLVPLLERLGLPPAGEVRRLGKWGPGWG